jgi:hypothetical protein
MTMNAVRPGNLTIIVFYFRLTALRPYLSISLPFTDFILNFYSLLVLVKLVLLYYINSVCL